VFHIDEKGHLPLKSTCSGWGILWQPPTQLVADCQAYVADCLLGLYWTGLTLLNGFSFLVNFFLFILGRAVD